MIPLYVKIMFATIIQLLNGDREVTFNRQSTTTDVTTESSVPELPVKFKSDIETLQRLYPEEFENHHGIVLTLKDALSIIPRDRHRTDAYKSLGNWMKMNLGIPLIIKSQKTR